MNRTRLPRTTRVDWLLSRHLGYGIGLVTNLQPFGRGLTREGVYRTVVGRAMEGRSAVEILDELNEIADACGPTGGKS